MSIIDTLITDRDQTDLDRLSQLLNEINEYGWESLTPTEKTEWYSLKATYKPADINRISTAINYLAILLTSYGYYITSSLKDTWLATDTLISSEIEAVLEKADELKAFFYGSVNIPSTMNNLTYEDANNIEKLLLEIERNITWMVTGFRKSGTFKSGQGVILP